MKRSGMKLRGYLWIAGGASILLLLACLLFAYMKMLLSFETTLLLTGFALAAGVVSLLLHAALTRPIHTSLAALSKQSKELAAGRFHARAPLLGPAEFRELAGAMNDMAEALSDSFEQVRRAEQSRRELVANVSHDLRTPLASIQSFVEALQDDVIQDEATFRRYLETIRLETSRLGGMIDDLFQLSRLDSGALKYEPATLFVDDLLIDLLQSHAVLLDEKRIEVRTQVAERMPTVEGMPELLTRALSNLLTNAIRYSPEGGEIRIAAALDEDGVRISVEDQGPGVPAERRERLFERFYRPDKSRSRAQGGAGLGLAIVASIAKLHDGEAGVESADGGGSRFWIAWPTKRKDVPSGVEVVSLS
ncbi:ATP-binding protein [Paenibacillus sp.]|uniref:sensor histidine kinase n=1 Tax=Paenibacillus sp. TaxID=58172 RepID=UPI002812881C|nr:ATP-binding protein [Paenibacillus sp.]